MEIEVTVLTGKAETAVAHFTAAGLVPGEGEVVNDTTSWQFDLNDSADGFFQTVTGVEGLKGVTFKREIPFTVFTRACRATGLLHLDPDDHWTFLSVDETVAVIHLDGQPTIVCRGEPSEAVSQMVVKLATAIYTYPQNNT